MLNAEMATLARSQHTLCQAKRHNPHVHAQVNFYHRMNAEAVLLLAYHHIHSQTSAITLLGIYPQQNNKPFAQAMQTLNRHIARHIILKSNRRKDTIAQITPPNIRSKQRVAVKNDLPTRINEKFHCKIFHLFIYGGSDNRPLLPQYTTTPTNGHRETILTPTQTFPTA